MGKKFRAGVKILDKNYKVGDVVKVQTIIIHRMDTGFAKDKSTGKRLPQFYVTNETIFFNDKQICDFEFGVSASHNPKIKFPFKVTGAGTLKVVFEDNKGNRQEKSIKVTPK